MGESYDEKGMLLLVKIAGDYAWEPLQNRISLIYTRQLCVMSMSWHDQN